ncbi:MAG: hypothetical protein Tsb0014_44960 [Pleurocapsa sp.]
MNSKILLTSFQTWLAHHKSNSSDDLLATVQKQNYDFVSLSFLRNLPVDIELASQKAIATIKELQPDAIICCGMAELRNTLTIESNAIHQNECLYTTVSLTDLIELLIATKLSEDAGKFVCEGLYYQILKFTQSLEKNIPCIFVHVPLLDKNNFKLIHQDFVSIIRFMDNFSQNFKTKNEHRAKTKI